MNRVDKLFRNLKKQGRCGLIAYVTCGDPDVETTVAIVRALEQSGADAVELGIPFSDPIADGPVIQAAAFRALQRGTRVADVLDIARQIRSSSQVPLIAFSYLNPVLRYGSERFAVDAAAAGIDSILITDLPPESAAELRAACRVNGLGMVFLLSPTSGEKRRAMIDRASNGFIYYVSTTGVTGTRSELDPGLIERLKEIRSRVSKPLAVGFGVSKNEHYVALSPHCDAVVVGSAIVRAIAEGDRVAAPVRAAAVVRSILGEATLEAAAMKRGEHS
ncbi:MAG TPA: tryptophan synthase subunit alpha [Thermoanaerobaculia bacterium]|nr:tryptophan synthase subunit alpha [Thermoanaerobaculia bacterium]